MVTVVRSEKLFCRKPSFFGKEVVVRAHFYPQNKLHKCKQNTKLCKQLSIDKRRDSKSNRARQTSTKMKSKTENAIYTVDRRNSKELKNLQLERLTNSRTEVMRTPVKDTRKVSYEENAYIAKT